MLVTRVRLPACACELFPVRHEAMPRRQSMRPGASWRSSAFAADGLATRPPVLVGIGAAASIVGVAAAGLHARRSRIARRVGSKYDAHAGHHRQRGAATVSN